MSEDTNDQLVEGDDLLPDAGVDPSDETDLDGQSDLEAGDEEEEELEELEVNGKKVALPKSVKAELELGTLRHKDYTLKTQELAEQRRAFESEKQTQAEQSKTFAEDNAKLYTVREQIKMFENADWAQVARQDAENGTQNLTLYRIEWDRLKDEASKLETGIGEKTAERTREQQQQAAKLIEQRDAVLSQEFPKWAEERPQIEAFAKANGVTEAELKSTTDPRIFRLLRYAKQGLEAEQRAKTTAKVQQQQQVTPAVTLTAARKTAAPASSPASLRQSPEAWAEQRNRELAAKGRR